LFIKRVALTGGARAQAPDVDNEDFGSTFAEVALKHDFLLGQSGNTARVGLNAGQFWYGGSKSYSFVEANAGHTWAISETTRLSLDGSVQTRNSNVNPVLDSETYALVASLRQARSNGDRLSFALNLRKTDSDFVNGRNKSVTLSAQYTFGKQVGPVKISTGVAATFADYPDYVALVQVPGGRQDRALYANVNFVFTELDYAGFAPTLRISAGRKFSNVSRFETEELSVSLGIQSKF
jgi:hypothetical protein